MLMRLLGVAAPGKLPVVRVFSVPVAAVVGLVAAGIEHSQLGGALLIPASAVAMIVVAAVAVVITDWGCLLLAAIVGAGAAIGTFMAHIPYISPVVHGAVGLASGLVAFEIGLIVMIGLRAAAGLVLKHRCVIYNWFPAAPPETPRGDDSL